MKYGFQKQSYGYLYETDFMGGDFHAIITVSEKGIISGKVIDVMNEEKSLNCVWIILTALIPEKYEKNMRTYSIR